MSPLSYALLEIGTVVLFGLTIWHAWRRGRGPLLELLAASAYGILLAIVLVVDRSGADHHRAVLGHDHLRRDGVQ